MRIFVSIFFVLVLMFVCGSRVSALEFKVSGSWVMSFGYGANGQFRGSYQGHAPTGWGQGQDNFEAEQRIQLQLEAVASENLSGTIQFQLGESAWGQNSTGAALGADRAITELVSAYMDWRIPAIKLHTRMGIQSLMTPAMASGNSVFNDQMAAIAATASFTDNLAITAFWARPYNDNYPGWDKEGIAHYRAGYLDNIDAFGLLIPIAADGLALTPWALGALLGPNALRGPVGENSYPFGNIANLGAGNSDYGAGMFPAGGARHRDFSNASAAHKLASYGSAWWAGLTGKISVWEPFRLAFDFEYGSVAWADNSRLNRSGWFATLLLEYNAERMTPGLYGWYSSGDDSNPANGSERLPALIPSNSNNYSWFAYDGAPWIERNAVIGNNMAGTWGVGIRISRCGVIEHLSQTLRANLIGGTNSPGMARKMSLAGLWSNGAELDFNSLGPGADLGMPGIYMTTMDQALELGSTSAYEVFDNFTICLEADYVFLWLDASDSVWGARHREGRHIPAVRDAWNVNASFVYSF